ncbi:MAG: L-2-hydroxyglutarate oxidase [Thermoleophilales bacterium]|nr:L-2-hydroxyglutarate oxidase [Thermoleophilales bacterium]
MSRTDRPPSACDIAVAGGGILGLAVARELATREPDARIVLLEAEVKLAAHQSSHNSGVVHAGVYYEPGSLRARLCVDGAARLGEYCAERELPWRASGKLIVATNEAELPRLDELERRGQANAVRELTRVGSDEIPEIEPAARGLAALHSPFTAVTDFAAIAGSFADDFEKAGGSIHLACPVLSARPAGTGSPSGGVSTTGTGSPARLRLRTPSGPLDCGRAVFCAGLQSDRLAVACGGSIEPRIVPIRGGYLEVKPGREDLVRGNVYPVPDPELPFLGAHLTRTFDGSLLIGPTAMIAGARDAYELTRLSRRDLGTTLRWPGTWELMRRHLRASMSEAANSIRPARLAREAARMVPGLTADDVIPGPSGVRAQALDREGNLIEDFLIEQTEAGVHVRNAPSPAATSSLALAGLIADRALT